RIFGFPSRRDFPVQRAYENGGYAAVLRFFHPRRPAKRVPSVGREEEPFFRDDRERFGRLDAEVESFLGGTCDEMDVGTGRGDRGDRSRGRGSDRLRRGARANQ